MRLVVYGMGYLGTTHASCMAELGHDVLGVDVDRATLDKLGSGECPFYEPDLADLLRRNIDAGRLQFTDSYREASTWGPAHFITVGTPQRKGEYAADLRDVTAVLEDLVPLLQQAAVIIGKSSVPVGTAERLAARAAELANGVDVDVIWNPEFLREGHAVDDTLRPDRIVVGAQNCGQAVDFVREIYAPILVDGVPFHVTDLATAELAKSSANAFLATKISFINAIAQVCEAAGADICKLANVIGSDPRIGREFLNAGLGFGGGCLPKDIRALIARADELGADHAITLLRTVDNINLQRRSRIVDIARATCGTLFGARVAVLGAAFKPGSDDIRDSPALDVAGEMQLQGADVCVYDPHAVEKARVAFPTLDYTTSALDACRGADVVLVLTEWPEFVELDPDAVGAVSRGRNIIDGRYCLSEARWRNAGWTYLC